MNGIKTTTETADPRPPASPAGLVFALLMIAAGVALFLDNLGIIHLRETWRYWPVLLIAYGVSCITRRRGVTGLAWAFIWMLIGGSILAEQLGYLHGNIALPLLLISFGVMSLAATVDRRSGRFLCSRRRPGKESCSEFTADGYLHETAVFSHSERKIMSRSFLGGDLVAIFGGVDIDLRNAAIPAGSAALLDTNVTFGGVDVRVPENWNVVMQGMPVFGAFEDKTVHYSGNGDPASPKLVITGRCVFGAVTVEN